MTLNTKLTQLLGYYRKYDIWTLLTVTLGIKTPIVAASMAGASGGTSFNAYLALGRY